MSNTYTVHRSPDELYGEDYVERSARMFVEDTIADAKHHFFEGKEVHDEDTDECRRVKSDNVTITITEHRGNVVTVQAMELKRDPEGNESTRISKGAVVAVHRGFGKTLYNQLARNLVDELSCETAEE